MTEPDIVRLIGLLTKFNDDCTTTIDLDERRFGYQWVVSEHEREAIRIVLSALNDCL